MTTTQKPDVNVEPSPRDLGEVCNSQLQTAGKIGLIALAVGSVLTVGYLMGHKNKPSAQDKIKNVTYFRDSQVQYFSHGPDYNGINFDVDKSDKGSLLLLEDFLSSGDLANNSDEAEDELRRVLFYEHNSRYEINSAGEFTRIGTPGKLSKQELEFVLEGCRNWVALPSENKQGTTFSKWYMSQFSPNYRKLVKTGDSK